MFLAKRFLGLIIALVFAFLFCLVRVDAARGSYYPKMAIFAPVGIIGGIFIILFPQYSGKPETKLAKALTLSVFGIGVALGIYNLYSIDPNFFKA